MGGLLITLEKIRAQEVCSRMDGIYCDGLECSGKAPASFQCRFLKKSTVNCSIPLCYECFLKYSRTQKEKKDYDGYVLEPLFKV